MEKFQIKKLAVAMALGLSTIAGTQVMAQANNFEEAKQHVASGKRVVEIGFAKERTKALKGFASGIPLVDVLKQITPNGWVVKKNDTADNRIDVNKLVSWTSGNAWNVTLESVMKQANTNAIIDWDKQEVTLIALPVNVTKTVTVTNVKENNKVSTVAASKGDDISVFELEGTGVKTETIVSGESNYKNLPSVVIENEAKARAVTEVAKVAQDNNADLAAQQALANQSWDLNSEKTLKQNVVAWGKQAGYKVEWVGEDYNVDRAMTIFGEFDGEDGPIKQLSVDYGPDSRLQKPLSFVFYQNKVLVVEDMKYEQQGFPQFGQ